MLGTREYSHLYAVAPLDGTLRYSTHAAQASRVGPYREYGVGAARDLVEERLAHAAVLRAALDDREHLVCRCDHVLLHMQRARPDQPSPCATSGNGYCDSRA